MEEERYPGERRGLTLFLGDLLPVVERALGADSLLAHCARRALRRGGLRDLRHASQIFNSLPRDTRSRLTKALVRSTSCWRSTAAVSRRRSSASRPSGRPWRRAPPR